MSKSMKRIHKVVIKRMYDESPDTSWLGEYGQRAESDYAIDREHATDCPQQTYNKPTAIINKLERAIDYLQHSEPESDFYDGDACDLIIQAQDSLAECTCGGQHLDRNSYQFFNPNHDNYAGCTPEEIRECCLQDYARMESLNNGDFCFIGIRAEAEIRFPYMTEGRGGRTYYKTEPITSGGLWGIESDSDSEHFKSIEAEELADLKTELKAIGFSSRAIATAFKNIEHTGNAR